MPQAIHNEAELVTLYAEQIASAAERIKMPELEEILSNAVADFGRTEGVSQTEALRALAERLVQMSAKATPAAAKVFAAAKEMALHKIQDPGDLL